MGERNEPIEGISVPIGVEDKPAYQAKVYEEQNPAEERRESKDEM